MFGLFKKPGKKGFFKASVTEINSAGDRYTYKIKADSKEEALIKLVEYFFGEKEAMIKAHDDIEQQHSLVTIPAHEKFYAIGMPNWLARAISGHARSKQELRKFAKKHNIKLKDEI